VTAINLFKHSKDAFAVEPGHRLFAEGEAGDVMYFVLEGAVEVTRGGHVVETLGDGAIIGELALIDTTPRSATATTSAPSRLVRIGRDEFTFLVQEHPTFALQVMAVMAERLRRANERVTPAS
jgi:CRP-like cAMP-binding protein